MLSLSTLGLKFKKKWLKSSLPYGTTTLDWYVATYLKVQYVNCARLEKLSGMEKPLFLSHACIIPKEHKEDKTCIKLIITVCLSY